MSNLQLIGGIIGLLASIPLLIGIHKGEIKQNFVTFLLWGLLDIISATTIILQHGNFWLPLGFAIGALSTAYLLFLKKIIAWTWIETLVVILVVACLFIWFLLGDRAAFISSIFALGVASIPQIVDTYKKPQTTPTKVYLIFCLANLLSLLGGKSFAIEEILYAGTALFLCLFITVLSVRKPIVVH